ncbi:MAG TPA: hypothetical protein DEB40_14520 [Elusimicrobia bacterium]|nr:hypothetical protein [Elusimicrobiota bacterium]HBT62948.1 hypothetical protein [Elusimicrobiota bacterium]
MKRVCDRSTARLEIPFSGCSLEVVKYAALSLTGAAFVRISRGRTAVVVELEAKKPANKKDLEKLAADFQDRIGMEAVRSDIAARDKGLREHIIRLALRGDTPVVEEPEIGLSEEQQKELDRLIAEVDAEIAKESSGKSPDPLGVGKTWEEAHGRDEAGKANRRK